MSLCAGWKGSSGLGEQGRGQTVPYTSLPSQVTNTQTRSLGSQRGECPFPLWLSWVARPGPTCCPNLPSLSPSRKDVNMAEFPVATGDQAFYRGEDIQLGEASIPSCSPTPAHTQRHMEGLTLLSPCTRLQKQHPEGEG